MVIFALMIAAENSQTKQICILHRDYEISSVAYLMRNQVKNSFKFVVRESFPCIAKGTRSSVIHDDKVCHIKGSKKPVTAYAFVSQGYPQRIIFAFLDKVLEKFLSKIGDNYKNYKNDQNLSISEITAEFKRYQEPKNVDKLLEAQCLVNETNVILYESVKKLLQRQGDLDQLVQKSKDLSLGAKQFYKSSKKMDKSCCTLI